MTIMKSITLSSLLLLLLFFGTAVVLAAEENLYKILGVDKTATTKEIKSAYRKKALATHPDKNKNVPPEQAAEAFHKVVNAFEILTDASSRKNYDRTGRAQQSRGGNGGGGGGGQQWQFKTRFTWNYGGGYYRQPLKDKFEVKEAMSRVMHIVSLEQLKTVMLDDDDALERNLLMIFLTPQLEKISDEELVFPYPFAAMSTQGIWWEDVMQTVKIRYYKENDVTKFFQIPHGDDLTKSGAPIILFGKRGKQLSPDNFVRLQTPNRHTFETWVWKRIEVSVNFVNKHDHPVEVFWIHERSAKMSMTIPAGHTEAHITMLSHEWWVRDARVDTRKDSPRRTKLSKESLLGIWKILSDHEGQEVVIETKACYDLSGHCGWWANQNGECKKNPVFMQEQCPKTCKFCVDDEDELKTTRDRKDKEKEAEKTNQPQVEPATTTEGQPTADGKDEL
jgi:hypothetical protein